MESSYEDAADAERRLNGFITNHRYEEKPTDHTGKDYPPGVVWKGQTTRTDAA